MFAVTHADHFHSINLHQNPKHYALAPRLLGSDFISRVQTLSPGLWFNPYVKVKDGELIQLYDTEHTRRSGLAWRLPRCNYVPYADITYLLIITRRHYQIWCNHSRQPMRRLARLEVALHGWEDAQAHPGHQGLCLPWIFLYLNLSDNDLIRTIREFV